MRSLGRPNRDQVATDRPASLTVLQALDLSNSAILADVLDRGASHLIDRFRGKDSEEIIEWMFQAALSRSPSEDERTAGIQLLGSTPTPESIEDLVWIVIMLPEFQIIR
jgi:hypothetical protein